MLIEYKKSANKWKMMRRREFVGLIELDWWKIINSVKMIM